MLKKKDDLPPESRSKVEHNRSYCGYKNPISLIWETWLIGQWSVTAASMHDSQMLEELLDDQSSGYCNFWADSLAALRGFYQTVEILTL